MFNLPHTQITYKFVVATSILSRTSTQPRDFRIHAEDCTHHANLAPYNESSPTFCATILLPTVQKIACRCLHAFWQTPRAGVIDPERENDASSDSWKWDTKWNCCLVIGNDALQSIENVPKPIGPTLSEIVDP
jgi:hypothetical protein